MCGPCNAKKQRTYPSQNPSLPVQTQGTNQILISQIQAAQRQSQQLQTQLLNKGRRIYR